MSRSASTRSERPVGSSGRAAGPTRTWPPDPADGRAGGRPGVGGAQDPARPADRPGPQSQELSDKLAAKLVPTDVATRLLDRFEEVGLIDDEAYARLWVASRGAGGGRSLARRALAQELRRKGIDDEVAREVLDEIDPAAEEEAARALVRKKLRTLTRVDDTAATRRLVSMLARKGYGSGLAFAVVRDELSHAGREPLDD